MYPASKSLRCTQYLLEEPACTSTAQSRNYSQPRLQNQSRASTSAKCAERMHEGILLGRAIGMLEQNLKDMI